MLHGFENVSSQLLYLRHDVPYEVYVNVAEIGAQIGLEVGEFHLIPFLQPPIIFRILLYRIVCQVHRLIMVVSMLVERRTGL